MIHGPHQGPLPIAGLCGSAYARGGMRKEWGGGGDKWLDKGRIELACSAPTQFVDNLFPDQALAIGTIQHHGGDSIGKMHDASQQRYGIPHDPIRIATTVPSFVVKGHCIDYIGVVEDTT